ncbi:MAG: 16S rRNA (adenine(1518)-N(6)/adenine(1519)-N(6))-dimethyltransferase RsmA [Clostridiaceae bacterium]|nr:16S rRNA (adenine(1518)-N(6)/adenine(1519)-N(6))-dimethyltransferase RsmA [Clostridiaceae bacterium]
MKNAYQETMFLLNKYNITANKSLGQNFLINDSVINDTINSADISREDLIIEIGPGLGTLTNELLEKAGKVIVIELDNRMINILNERFCLYKNFEIIHEDVLKVDLKKLIKENKENNNLKNAKVVANLPYYITTPIIMKLLEEKLDIETITVMVQKEVAKRLTAKPSEKLTGAITYSVQYYCEAIEKVEVPKESFIPAPEVESEVIQLILRKESPVKVNDEDKLFKLIKSSFMQRRKTFLNGVSNSGLVSKDKLKNTLKELQIDENIRGENLTLEQFAKISDMI